MLRYEGAEFDSASFFMLNYDLLVEKIINFVIVA